ncbi:MULTISPECIES: hypothetical protein [Acinetobacter]|uniref:hypothetical protein n=1 Tax=Acinetobacter TaxID=469 RepID=UPI0002CEBDCD|nr:MULTISPECIES: hypothetical protein [Pseudomonadota]ENX31103.1 hypothetical protein F890_01247 [Acinetobacter sp. CIP 64.7]MCU4420230.1 hypothetical protein [Acinetobacter lwoffii]MCU4451162.1 hypothetical protein [Acinetobacter lwoffii]QJB49384.1 hypothetical protein HGD77_12205 [Acinetobacter sp. NEB149]UVA99991.1 hypothetical protein ABWED_0677 [Acinetobacter lwoffii]
MDIQQHAPESGKLDKKAHFCSAWPLILILFGGAIGTFYAVIAYLLNLKIYSSELTRLNKVLANLLCGMSAISAWWFSAQWIQGTFFQ